VGFKRISAYIQDTITWGKLTASIGIRYDKESGNVHPLTQPYYTWYEPGSPHHNERMLADLNPAQTLKNNDAP
jgi:outer membrane receptor protein involved in Fe transport